MVGHEVFTLTPVRGLQEEVQELKAHRREWEEEADRCKLLYLAQERRIEELQFVLAAELILQVNDDVEDYDDGDLVKH